MCKFHVVGMALDYLCEGSLRGNVFSHVNRE